ncbi:MAG TPA: nucleotide exchange factor GrpE [bacterium]|nr:nucleotide exchange factor GrpE [bacterium]
MSTEHGGERPEGDEAAGEAGEHRQPADSGALSADGPEDLTIDELRAKLRQAREDTQRNWQHFLHSAADLENYKKQAARDRQDAVERTRRQMLSLVLGVLDNLERALAFGDVGGGSGKALVDGLRMTHRQILSQLEAVGVRPMEAVGRPFDPKFHEAVGVVPPQASGPSSGTVANEVLKGYLLNDDILRPAKVTVVGGSERPAP